MDRQAVVTGVANWTHWWIDERKKKFRNELSETMSVNPFMLPILFELHGIQSFEELSNFIVGSHLMIGHSTGFGKLMDEKILPGVFGTIKLDKKYRGATEPYLLSRFNEIDHVVRRPSRQLPDLLSLKAGKWTIQLTMAKQLNTAFNEILGDYADNYGEIAVGVIYGSIADLTDKYDILRGINRGANHDVIDLTERVSVYTGRAFWAWLNEDEEATQDWVLDGIIEGIRRSNPREGGSELLARYNASVAARYQRFVREDGSIDWHALLASING